MLALNELYNIDCMDGMREFPDKYFDLAIVDPPYGGGVMNGSVANAPAFGGSFDKYEIKAQPIKANRASISEKSRWKKYGEKIKHWDIAPTQEYFSELFRVSKNQIIFGGNYFSLPPTRCFIVWRKTSIPEKFSMAMCEYAWTSFNANAKILECVSFGKDRFHPTQKPVSLYRWLLKNYAKHGDKILDTHAGSASSFVAANEAGFDYIGFEIDEGYYTAAQERMRIVKAQGKLFDHAERAEPKQHALI